MHKDFLTFLVVLLLGLAIFFSLKREEKWIEKGVKNTPDYTRDAFSKLRSSYSEEVVSIECTRSYRHIAYILFGTAITLIFFSPKLITQQVVAGEDDKTGQPK